MLLVLFPVIGVCLQERGIIRLPLMKEFLRDSFNIGRDLILLVHDGGCGIHGQDGGLLES